MTKNKHVIAYSFIGLFIFVLSCVTLYRYFIIEEVILKQLSEEHLYVADKYKAKIWNAYPHATSKLHYNDYADLLQDQDFIDFLQQSSAFFQNVKAEISLYDWSGVKFVTNENSNLINAEKAKHFASHNQILTYLDQYFLKEYMSNNSISEAFKGKISHCFLFKMQLNNREGKLHDRSYLVSYIPLIDSIAGNFRVVGVFEIISEITQQKNNIVALEQRMLIAFIIVFCVSFIVILYKVTNAQAALDRQVEVSRSLEEQKNRTEIDNIAKTDFMANVSHELRTPLNAIIGFSQMILDEQKDKLSNEKYRSYIVDIHNSGSHLLTIVNDILDFSKASIDKLQIEKTKFDLGQLAIATMRLIMPKARENGVKLAKIMPPAPIMIIADPQRLKQALLNILANAVKFSKPGAQITLNLSLDQDEKYATIIIVDEGVGMSEKDIPKALSPFGQVDNEVGRLYEGTGLGLPLTKKLLELMYGTFELKSLPNQGTKIIMRLPYAKEKK